MSIPANTYMERCYAELNKDTVAMNHKNSLQPVYTRKLTKEEIEKLSSNPDYIKEINREHDNQEWQRVVRKHVVINDVEKFFNAVKQFKNQAVLYDGILSLNAKSLKNIQSFSSKGSVIIEFLESENDLAENILDNFYVR